MTTKSSTSSYLADIVEVLAVIPPGDAKSVERFVVFSISIRIPSDVRLKLECLQSVDWFWFMDLLERVV